MTWMAGAEHAQGFVRWHCWPTGEVVEREPGAADLGAYVYAVSGDGRIERRILDERDPAWLRWRRAHTAAPAEVWAGEQLPPPPVALRPPPAPVTPLSMPMPPRRRRPHRWRRRHLDAGAMPDDGRDSTP